MSSAFNIPAGYALVPLEPTTAMFVAAMDCNIDGGDCTVALDGGEVLDVWGSMLAAAPTPPIDAVPGEPVPDLAKRGLIGVIGTAQAQAKRILASESDVDDLRQDRIELPRTLDVIRHAVESRYAGIAPAAAAEPATGEDLAIYQSIADNYNADRERAASLVVSEDTKLTQEQIHDEIQRLKDLLP